MGKTLPMLVMVVGVAALTTWLLVVRPAPPGAPVVKSQPDRPLRLLADATRDGLALWELPPQDLPPWSRRAQDDALTIAARAPVTSEELASIREAWPDETLIYVFGIEHHHGALPRPLGPVEVYQFTPDDGWQALPRNSVLPRSRPAR